jgi:hypothetical protein
MPRPIASAPRPRAFTLLEVALIVAIIGMMLLIIVGYLFAPKAKGPLPPVKESLPIPSSSTEEPPKPIPTLDPSFLPKPVAATPVPVATPPPQIIQVPPQPEPAPAPAAPPEAAPAPSPSFR